MQRFLLLLLIAYTPAFSLNAQFCNDDRFTAVDYFSDAEIITEIEIPYGLADEWFMALPQPSLNAFDIAYPDPAIDPMELRPVIILAHGGGFWGGEKEALAYHINELAKSGYVAVSANYRKGWMGSPIDCDGDPMSLQVAIYRAMQDVQACIRYITANADVYGIDTSRIYAGGESAGVYATLTSQVFTQEEWEADHPYFEALYGPIIGETNDIEIDFDIKGYINMWGGVHDTLHMDPAELRPTVSFYGNLDDVIPPGTGTIQNCPDFEVVTGSADISAFLTNNGICNYTHNNPIQGHEAYEPAYAVDHISCFVKSLLCESCETGTVYYGEADCADEYAAATTDIAQFEENTLTMFPNPASVRINTLLDGVWSAQTSAVILNAAGQLMPVTVSQSGNTWYADVQSLPPGLYLMQMADGPKVATGAFMVTQ